MGKESTIIFVMDKDLSSLEHGISMFNGQLIESVPVWAGPRPILEDYLEGRQVLPYVVIKKDGKFLRYRRAVSGGENRLHGKISIGIGGHIDIEDAVLIPKVGAIDLMMTMHQSAIREIYEEIGIRVKPEDLNFVAIIRCNDTPVDAVHVAMVAICDISHIVIGNLTFEDTVDDVFFATKEEIVADPVEKETWSNLVLEML